MLRTGLPGEVHQFIAVLADEPFLVVTGNVVPHCSVSIEVVKHCNLYCYCYDCIIVGKVHLHRPRHAPPPPGTPCCRAEAVRPPRTCSSPPSRVPPCSPASRQTRPRTSLSHEPRLSSAGHSPDGMLI